MPRRTAVLFILALSAAAAAMGATTYPQPLPASFSPTSGPPGTVITVTGSGFTGLSQVWIGNARNSSVHVVSDTLVKVTVANGATTAHLGFINPQHSEFTSRNFTVTTGFPPPPPPAGATISGAVAGPADTTVLLTGKSTRVANLNSARSYSFSGVGAGTYTLSPNVAGHVFTPTSVAAHVADAPISNVNFSGSATSAPTYSISGTISGAVAADVIVTLNGANVGSTATDLGGSYSFSGLPRGTYSVAAALPGHAFSQPKIVAIDSVDSMANNLTSAVAPSGADIKIAAVDPLPAASVGRTYFASVLKAVNGGRGAYHYQSGTFASGTPPLGMILNHNGTLTGTPKIAGVFKFALCATDDYGDISATCAPTSITVGGGTPPPPPPPPAGTSWVYYNGVFDWPGDYSFVASPNYADTSGAPLSGPHDIKITLQGAWGGWLPYAKNWNFNSNGYTKLTFALKPTVANQSWSVYFVKVGDVPVGIYLDVAKYGPAPVPGKWATYTVPLADLGVLNTSIYKFCIQDKTGLSNNTWFVDNVGFEQ